MDEVEVTPQTMIVEAKIDVNSSPMTVTLKGLQLNLPPRMTFFVRGGDLVTWKLKDANGAPKSFPARVRFDNEGGEPLFKEQNIFPANADTITSVRVNKAAKPPDFIANGTPHVAYRYHFELETSPGTFTDLVCLWTDGTITPMGGGEKGPRPTRP